MDMKAFAQTSRSALTVCWMISVALLLSGCGTHVASAQNWTTNQPHYAYLDYNTYYLYQDSSNYYHFSAVVNGSSPLGFWQSAEQLDMAVDALIWAQANSSGDVAAYQTEVLNLVNGFRHLHGDDWSSNKWNDDLDVAIIAFIRAYHYTGSTCDICLTDAQNNFNTVWSRAQQGNGGLCENSSGTLGCYENSSANWTFAIAGWLIDWANGHQGSYLSEANGVYTWALANLYNSSTGRVDDAHGSTDTGQYDYNYGYAIGAAALRGDAATVGNMTNYLMNNMNNLNYPYSGTYNGYNLLPNYGQGAQDNDGGFNGITMRWTGYAYARGEETSSFLPWAQANVGHAWAMRNSSGLSWDNWNASTPANVNGGQPYSWDCSSTVVGLFNIPAPLP